MPPFRVTSRMAPGDGVSLLGWGPNMMRLRPATTALIGSQYRHLKLFIYFITRRWPALDASAQQAPVILISRSMGTGPADGD